MVHASTGNALRARRLEASDFPSTHRQGLSALVMNIFGRVQIAVMMFAALWTIPLPHIEREAGQNVAATVAPFTAWEEAVHKPQLPAVSFALVSEQLSEPTEAGIADRPGEAMVFDHPPHVQVLDADAIVSAHQIGGHLVQVILSGVTDVFLNPCNANALPVPPAASFFAPGENALGLGKTSLVFTRMVRIANALSIREGSEAVDSQVNPDRFSGRFELGKLFIQNQRDKVSSTWTLGDCDSGWTGRELAAPVHVQSPKSADNQIRVVRIRTGELESGNRIFCALFMPFLLKGRVSSFFVKEANESVVQVAQRLLGGNRRDFPEPCTGRFFFPFSKFIGGFKVTNSGFGGVPRISSEFQSAIINISTASKNFFKLRFL